MKHIRLRQKHDQSGSGSVSERVLEEFPVVVLVRGWHVKGEVDPGDYHLKY